jgi:single-strand selective monofunctional uracil DNA glycosylase
LEPLDAYRALLKNVSPLRFASPVDCVYNPLEYAWKPFARYLELYGRGPKEAVLLGMNPGPWGMAQTGIPFGEVSIVRDWLGIDEPVGKPAREHPKRPVTGFDCRRSEVSGARLWGWARRTFITPESFFSRFLILNYCPLSFMEAGGKNLTPDKLPAGERLPLEAACDLALRRVVSSLKPRRVIGVGGFAAKRAAKALEGFPVEFLELLHPSPANPLANKGWDKAADELLRRLAAS